MEYQIPFIGETKSALEDLEGKTYIVSTPVEQTVSRFYRMYAEASKHSPVKADFPKVANFDISLNKIRTVKEYLKEVQKLARERMEFVLLDDRGMPTRNRDDAASAIAYSVEALRMPEFSSPMPTAFGKGFEGYSPDFILTADFARYPDKSCISVMKARKCGKSSIFKTITFDSIRYIPKAYTMSDIRKVKNRTKQWR